MKKLSKMIIRFLQAGNGDCIYINGATHHVIIDSGEYCAELEEVIKQIKQKEEAIDLLVISHYDSDHIKAICKILKSISLEERKHLIKKVWFNATKLGFAGNEKNLSATDATELSSLLLEAGIPWTSELKKGTIENIYEGFSLEVLDGGSIYKAEETGSPLSNVKCDWHASFAMLETYLNDDSLDNSQTNKQSIILVVHLGDHEVLLPGDAVPEKLSLALTEYGNGDSCRFDLIKLPHHGSYKNITKAILDKLICSDYVISTDGSVYFHPNKKMMLKVAKWGHGNDNYGITFHLNYYDTLKPQLGITQEEQNKYGFKLDGQRVFEF